MKKNVSFIFLSISLKWEQQITEVVNAILSELTLKFIDSGYLILPLEKKNKKIKFFTAVLLTIPLKLALKLCNEQKKKVLTSNKKSGVLIFFTFTEKKVVLLLHLQQRMKKKAVSLNYEACNPYRNSLQCITPRTTYANSHASLLLFFFNF